MAIDGWMDGCSEDLTGEIGLIGHGGCHAGTRIHGTSGVYTVAQTKAEDGIVRDLSWTLRFGPEFSCVAIDGRCVQHHVRSTS